MRFSVRNSISECSRISPELMHVPESTTFADGALHHLGEVERADDHVLGGGDERSTVCR
jgi:hypothetical protein